MIRLFRSLTGAALLGLAIGAACSSGSSSPAIGIPGFGHSCTRNSDCAEFDLLCDDHSRCAECLTGIDCGSNETCTDGLCKEMVACEASDQCAGGEVCDRESGSCVECVRASDCSDEEICVGGSCIVSADCSENDCPDNQVCDLNTEHCVECLESSDCSGDDLCVDHSCVGETDGSGGSGNGAGATSGSSGGNGNTGSGAANSSGGTGDGTGAATSSGAANSTGGTGSNVCECENNFECDADNMCVNPDVIDDFLDCDDFIVEVRDREGDWYGDADDGFNQMFAVSEPSDSWGDTTCGAWMTGGRKNAVTDDQVRWAVMGVHVAEQNASLDWTGYDGLTVRIESDDPVLVIVKTDNGAVFGVSIVGTTDGSANRIAYFDDMTETPESVTSDFDLSQVTEIQFAPIIPGDVPDPFGFGFAVHKVTLHSP